MMKDKVDLGIPMCMWGWNKSIEWESKGPNEQPLLQVAAIEVDGGGPF